MAIVFECPRCHFRGRGGREMWQEFPTVSGARAKVLVMACPRCAWPRCDEERFVWIDGEPVYRDGLGQEEFL